MKKNHVSNIYSPTAYLTKEEQTEALVAELEHAIHSGLRTITEAKGEQYVKDLCSKLPLQF